MKNIYGKCFLFSSSMGAKVIILHTMNYKSAASIPHLIRSRSRPTVSAVSARTRGMPERIFVFHTDEFWLNLHHFLYVLGRAENKETDTAREAVSGAPADQEGGLKKLNAKEQKVWREAVASYAAGVSKRDIVFDSPLPAVTAALARARDSKTLTGAEIDSEIATVLQGAAPIYRKAWWKKHREANQRWQK